MACLLLAASLVTHAKQPRAAVRTNVATRPVDRTTHSRTPRSLPAHLEPSTKKRNEIKEEPSAQTAQRVTARLEW
ncbi:hypothetical protein BKA80DRAFT_259206 [Phyllosticta citrichinensis]